MRAVTRKLDIHFPTYSDWRNYVHYGDELNSTLIDQVFWFSLKAYLFITLFMLSLVLENRHLVGVILAAYILIHFVFWGVVDAITFRLEISERRRLAKERRKNQENQERWQQRAAAWQ